MIILTQPTNIKVKHNYIKNYRIEGLNLIEDNDYEITFKNYAQMSKYLGITRQGLYNLIRKNMNPIDVLANIINSKIKKSNICEEYLPI